MQQLPPIGRLAAALAFSCQSALGRRLTWKQVRRTDGHRLLSSLDYRLLRCAIALTVINPVPHWVSFLVAKSASSWIHWLVVAWSLQLGCKLPKELRKQSRLIGLEVCFDSNESFFESGPTTSRRAVTAHHQSCPKVVGAPECTTGVTVGRNRYMIAVGAVRAYELKGGSALIK